MHGSFYLFVSSDFREINYKRAVYLENTYCLDTKKVHYRNGRCEKENVKKIDVPQPDNDKILTAMEEKEVEQPIHKPKAVVPETKEEHVQEETTSEKKAEIKSKRKKIKSL